VSFCSLSVVTTTTAAAAALDLALLKPLLSTTTLSPFFSFCHLHIRSGAHRVSVASLSH
jgi:hypothetical protein